MDSVNLKGKVAFIAGVGDDQGYGWAIAKSLAEAGCRIIVGTWPPIYRIFKTSYEQGKFGKTFEIEKIYPFDAAYDISDDVPQEIRENKRYQAVSEYTIEEAAKQVEKDYGKIDIIVHSIANGPEAGKDLLETSRQGYLAAVNASSYSFVSMMQKFGPILNEGGSALTITYIASERAVPGYGGGLSGAKAALESDTRTLAWEAGRKWGVRVNTISAGPLRSRAARAIGFIDKMIDYSIANSPLKKELNAEEIGSSALFLLSPMASAVTGVTFYVDNGLHAMGVAANSPSLQ